MIESEISPQQDVMPAHEIEMEEPSNQDINENDEPAMSQPAMRDIHPQIVITPATVQLHGPKQFILDTETTGFYYQDSDRIVEVGAIEMVNRKLTGSSIHIYINPEKPVGDSEAIHGSEIIAHNASFDMNFLDMEFKRSGLQALSEFAVMKFRNEIVLSMVPYSMLKFYLTFISP
ncbi:unnamed protein product [Oppiella nova]|uniref:Exonuclease domain-containing protein n=1 Tax=Oppiella nova TaxID=334625 RepID=A0A7R9L8H3_9ACAR|nr:unnamed protein product [Oppiella nova]CAG2159477.1 unnamed protein product [Oppiella nova]